MQSSQPKAKAKIQIQKSVAHLSNILPVTSQVRNIIQDQLKDLTTDHIQTIHKTIPDTQYDNKQFICIQANRHKKSLKSFRSPYTNNYYPITQDHNTYPSPILRDLEEKGNILFEEYARLYYGEDNCTANFYVYQTEEGLNVVFCLKKGIAFHITCLDYNDQSIKGVWSSTNVCQIRGDPNKSVTYKLQTSILYQLQLKQQSEGNFINISGSMKKNKVEAKKLMQQYEIDQFHLMICGKLIQQNQTLLRQQIESIFLAKSKQICFKNRYQDSKQAYQRKIQMGKEFVKLRSQTNRIVE